MEKIPMEDGVSPEDIEVAADQLYWTDGRFGNISRSNLNAAEIEVLVSTDLMNPGRVDVDVDERKIYWTEGEWIRRANLNGSQVEDVVLAYHSGGPADLTLDLRNHKLYWSHYFTGWGAPEGGIYRANLDGSQIDHIWSENARALEVDPVGGHLFFTDESGHVNRSELNGLNAEALAALGGRNRGAASFALDPVDRALFYNSLDKVWRRTLDDPHETSLIQSGRSGITDLAFDPVEERLYWVQNLEQQDSTWRSIVRRCSETGLDTEVILELNGSRVTGLVVVPDGSMSTAVHQELPDVVHLFDAYPNPFKPDAKIRFRLSKPEYVSIEVTDLLGRRVALLHDGIAPAGAQTLTWRPDGQVPAGTYFLTLQTASTSSTRPIVYSK
jgi:hypothetical protein